MRPLEKLKTSLYRTDPNSPDNESRWNTIAVSNGQSEVKRWQYEYNAMGMITQLVDDADTYDYGYDATYQLISESLNGTNIEQWIYDEAGNCTRKTGGSESRASLFNDDNELFWFTDDTADVINVTGNVSPGEASNKWYNSTAESRTRRTAVDSNDGTFTITNVPIYGMTNVLEVVVEDVSENRATQTVSFTKQSIGGVNNLYYDMNGNLTNWITHTSDVVYVYDMENRLRQVVRNGETVLECWYDGQSRRIAKKEIVDNSTNHYQYVYDGWTVLAVLNKDGKMLEYYSRGIGLAGDIGAIVAATHTSHSTTNGTFYYHSNHRGDVTSVRSETNTVATYAYRPFGELKSSTGPYAARYGFSSKEYDPSTGFNYYGYRFYSPRLGRWTSRDPIGERGGMNLYGFVNNFPINKIDHLGLWFEWVPILGSIESYIRSIMGIYPGMEPGDYASCQNMNSAPGACETCIANKELWYGCLFVAPNVVKLGIDYGVSIVSTYLGVAPIAIPGWIISIIDTAATMYVHQIGLEKIEKAANKAEETYCKCSTD